MRGTPPAGVRAQSNKTPADGARDTADGLGRVELEAPNDHEPRVYHNIVQNDPPRLWQRIRATQSVRRVS